MLDRRAADDAAEALWSIDTLLVQISQGKLLQTTGPHVDLPAAPFQLASSPDGGRIYVSLPDRSQVGVIE